MDQDPIALETLVEGIRTAGADTDRLDLWVPDNVTLGGVPIPADPSGIVAAILGDTALSVGLWPGGATEGPEGKTYHFVRER